MSKYELNCWICNHPISEARDTVYYDDSTPPRAYCKECWEDRQEEKDED